MISSTPTNFFRFMPTRCEIKIWRFGMAAVGCLNLLNKRPKTRRMQTIPIGLKYEILQGRTIESYWLEPLLFDKGHFCSHRDLAFLLSAAMDGGRFALIRLNETTLPKANVGSYVGAIDSVLN